eukprot:TRINITY_DN421_c0_g1_i1.p1 TRINITY_DN421_c0_g1~~TRINITY_DN421_c0_g1_i1.p1  ORF type:complete len:522 (+),score=148.22 TRINITY_DN421_c0_g1_i1:175-1740(+)
MAQKLDDSIDRKVLRKFDVGAKLGTGAYGIVWKSVDKKTKDVVALKKIFDAFQNPTDAQRTFREIMFLQEFSDHENIIRLHNVMKAENNSDIYLVFEFMETDLHAVIRAGILEEIHKQYIVYQLLRALKYVHSAQVLHRDLKPSNILLNSDCLLKVADFGLARSIKDLNNDDEKVLTEYVATRWYRAPEILLGSTKYTKEVDMWAVGCITAELLGGKPIFPGSSTLNQLERVIEITGQPSAEDIESTQSSYAATLIESIHVGQKRNIRDLYPKASDAAISLLENLLAFNPSKRMSADEALRHPWVAQFHNEEEEPDMGRAIDLCLDDDSKFSISDYRNSLYDDIKKKRKNKRQKAREDREARKKKRSSQNLSASGSGSGRGSGIRAARRKSGSHIKEEGTLGKKGSGIGSSKGGEGSSGSVSTKSKGSGTKKSSAATSSAAVAGSNTSSPALEHSGSAAASPEISSKTASKNAEKDKKKEQKEKAAREKEEKKQQVKREKAEKALKAKEERAAKRLSRKIT